MKNGWTRKLVFLLLIALAYRYRYRLLNLILGVTWFRNLAVRCAMAIPLLRSRLIQSTFQ